MDGNKFLGLIRMKGLTVPKLLDDMDNQGVPLSKATFYKAIKGERQFKAKEIAVMANTLNLSQDDIMNIFFKELVS